MSGVVVAGMHRSGTSLMTRMIAAAGWHPGEHLLSAPGEHYGEDATFVALHRRWLDEHLPDGEGHGDWGVSTGGRVDLATVDMAARTSMLTAAQEFTARRDVESLRWVAKDPRASLFLPVWAAVESLRFVLVYRTPWDVVDSAVRLGAEVWCRSPRYALSAWLDHNRRLVEFATAHRDRCVVVASERLTLDPGMVWDAVGRVIDVGGTVPAGLVDPERYVRRGDEHPVAALYSDVHPEHVHVLRQLDRLADVPRQPGTGSSRGRTGAAPIAVPGGSLEPGTGVQVIIPCRDDGDHLIEAIASVDVCAASYPGPDGKARVELTVVDDGSRDTETLRILDALRATGRQIVVTSGLGLAAARNAGMQVSATRAVIPLDADNRLRPCLVAALDTIEAGAADVVHGSWRRFGLESGVVRPPEMTFDALVPGNTIDACAIIGRELLARLGGWDPALQFWEDWDLWLGAVGVGARTARLDAVTFDYLVRPGSLSAVTRADSAARERMVSHIATKHGALLGSTVTRMVLQVHRSHAAHWQAEEARARVEEEYRALEVAYRELETAYRELAAAWPTNRQK